MVQSHTGMSPIERMVVVFLAAVMVAIAIPNVVAMQDRAPAAQPAR